MRSATRSLALVSRGPRAAPLDTFSRTEKIIAFCRMLLATATLVVVIVDPKQPSFRADLAYVVLNGYVGYSILLFLLVRAEMLRQEHLGWYSCVLDVAWISLISPFTEGGTSPFFLLHVFVISSVSVRWGFRATMLVTIVLALLYPSVFFLASHTIGSEVGFRRVHLIRPIYLLTLAYLIGYLGEHERRSKRKLGFMLELPAVFRRGRAPGRALVRLMRRALAYFQAERGLLVLRDPESGRFVTRDPILFGGQDSNLYEYAVGDPINFADPRGLNPLLLPILAGAGVYQLTPAKGVCLRHCHSPLGFLMSRWRDGVTGAFHMGVQHGLYCLGCCWAMMAVLFVVGVMSLAWVGALTVFVLLEKVGPYGSIVARVAGAALIVFGIVKIV